MHNCYSKQIFADNLFFADDVQKINMLIVNQSIVDMFGSFFALLSAVVEVGGTRMSYDTRVRLVGLI